MKKKNTNKTKQNKKTGICQFDLRRRKYVNVLKTLMFA